jgi:NAD+ diphosphatase
MMMRGMPFELPDLFVDQMEADVDDRDVLWLIFRGSQLLVDSETMWPAQVKDITIKHQLYMGTFRDFHIYVGEMDSPGMPSNTLLCDLRELYGRVDEAIFGLAGRAIQLITWDRTHQFCGQCGTHTLKSLKERARECVSCGLLTFPRISPVIMVLIQKGKEILLARGVNFPNGYYSALAGFVDAGETLEHCVKREVMEEVGLEVDQLRYFGSQPWPFPHSLMIAFTCQWKSGDIVIDPSEIVNAQWFTKDNLPLLAPTLSISRILIDAVLAEHE